LSGCNDTGAVGANQASLSLGLQNICDTNHVYQSLELETAYCIVTKHTMLRDSLSDTREMSLKFFKCKLRVTYHTTKGISAAIASSIPAAARGGLGINISQIFYPEIYIPREFHTVRR
jgi:hypothetical protein